MKKPQKLQDKKHHLKLTMVYFSTWMCAAYLLISEIRTDNASDGIIGLFLEGQYKAVILLALSIILFALFIRSMFLLTASHAYRANKSTDSVDM